MRTAAEFRDRQLELLASSLQRPGMFCGSHGDLYFGKILRDLIWLDERSESQVDHALSLLWGALQVFGQLDYQGFPQPDQFASEVASTYTQAAFRLGYYSPKRLLTREEYLWLVDALDADFFLLDHEQNEIQTRFGDPSHEVIGGQTTVYCYGCEDVRCEWVYFDFSRCYPPKDGETCNWFREPILRNVRRVKNKFEPLPFASWFQNIDAED